MRGEQAALLTPGVPGDVARETGCFVGEIHKVLGFSEHPVRRERHEVGGNGARSRRTGEGASPGSPGSFPRERSSRVTGVQEREERSEREEQREERSGKVSSCQSPHNSSPSAQTSA